MPDPEPKKDAALMEPAPQGHTIPAEPPATAQPQSAAQAAPAPSPAPAAPRPSAAPAPSAPAAAQPSQEPSPAQTLVTVTYKGKEFKLPPEAAEAWNERQAAFDGGYKKTLEELNELKKLLPAPAKPAEPTPEEKREQLATRLLTEPDKVLLELREEIKKDLVQQYQRDVSVREFQSKWWSDNKELLPYREIFDALLLQRAEQYMRDGLSDSQAYDRNAEALRKMILGIRGNASAPAGAPAAQHVESPAPTSGGGTATEPAGEPVFTSLTDAMRARKSQKLQSALHGTKAAPAA